jgi:septal ring factor EnvC (AmiA/AmiB activator)
VVRFNAAMAKSSRVPPAVGSIPVVGDLVKQADEQARWLQDVVEQNTRLVAQLPATMKSFNDSLERFNQTVARLDRLVSQVERTTATLIGPLEQLSQRMERLATVLGDMPGAGLVRRLTGGQRPPGDGEPPAGPVTKK